MQEVRNSLRTIFNEALEIQDPGRRAEYLARACGADGALHQKIEVLLQAHQEAGGFLKTQDERRVPPRTVPLPVTEKPGDRIGRYKLLQEIGEGGCGVVYMAEQEEPIRRRVALKVIKLGMDTRNVIARFEAERQALALMDHPNIAKVLDAGATGQTILNLKSQVSDSNGSNSKSEISYLKPEILGGRPYFVMELVRGIKITDYCDQHNLSTRLRLDLFVQVCHAIQHAHQKGIIHRDIKPSNILVTLHDGVPVPKVIDFGIAKATTDQPLTDKTVFTAFEQFIGTPAYMSPEQAEMSGLDIDTRSDIYALGVLLYELLTGRTPFDAGTLLAAGLDGMRRTIREQEPLRPSTRLRALANHGLTTTAQRRGTEVPKLIHLLRGDLDWIVMKCLEKDRARRYETANGLARDIERHLYHEPVAARPPSTAYRVRKFVRRNKLMMTATAAIATALVLGVLISTWQWVQATNAKRDQGRLRQMAEDRLVQVNAADAGRLLNEDQGFEALPWLVEALRVQTGRADGEALQRRQLGLILQQCPQLAQIWFHDGPVGCAGFSPDGRRVATGTAGNGAPGQVQVWDMETGQAVGRPLQHAGGIKQLRFSPDGRTIGTASADGTARIWDSRSGDPITPSLCHSNVVLDLAFSRDGRLLATASRDNTARVWDAQSGRPVTAPLPHLFVVGGVDFSPDGQRLVTVSFDGRLHVWDVKRGTLLQESSGHTSHYLIGVQWSPDGSKWLTASLEMGAKTWDANRAEVLAAFQQTVGVNRAAFSPDGRQVVTACVNKTARVWDAQSGMPLTPPIRHDGEVYYAEFSPDGLAIVTASSDHTARVWDAKTGQPLTPSLIHQAAVKQALFSPDGHHLLTASDDGTVRLWELAIGGPSLELRHQGPVTHLALSPEPNYLRVVTGSADRSAQVWNMRTGQPIGLALQHRRGVSQAVFSPNGQQILTTSFDGTARVWDADTGKPVAPPMQHQEGITQGAFSPDGRRVATASTDKTAAVWEAATGRRILSLLHPREVQWVAFSPDGERVVTACRDGVGRVWDATTGQELLPLKGHGDWVLQAVFSPNGKLVLTTSADKTARLWDAATGTQRAHLDHGGIVISAAFSGDGSRIVTASYDQTARVWDAATGRAQTPPLRHDDLVRQAAFSSDGRWVVTASADRTVRLWNATTGDPVTSPIRLGADARDAQLSRDGQTLLTASGSAAQVWNLVEEGRPLEDLHLMTELLTGPNQMASVEQLWRKLKARSSGPRTDARSAVLAWHRRALVQALEQQDGFAARFHVDRLLPLTPTDDSLLKLRARLDADSAGLAAGEWAVANQFVEARACIPPPAPGTPENLIDLSDYYTRPLADAPNTDWPSEIYNLSSLTRGVQTLATIQFDLRGWVRLLGRVVEPGRFAAREAIRGIKVGRQCRRLDFLHGTGWVVAEGTEIASYVIHYADGQLAEQPVRYGHDVRNFVWWPGSEIETNKDALCAWWGTNALTAQNGMKFRLYLSVWQNPRPDVAVATIDYLANPTACDPFLIAITAETTMAQTEIEKK